MALEQQKTHSETNCRLYFPYIKKKSLCVHIASKWNLFASWSLSRKSSFRSRQWRNTIIRTIRPHVPTKASPVSVIPRLGVIKSLASQCPGSLGGFGITYIWELGIIYKENNSSIVALGCTLFVLIHYKKKYLFAEYCTFWLSVINLNSQYVNSNLECLQ